jgi:hypothetical protein
MPGVRDFFPVFASFVRARHEPLASQYCHLNNYQHLKLIRTHFISVVFINAGKGKEKERKRKRNRKNGKGKGKKEKGNKKEKKKKTKKEKEKEKRYPTKTSKFFA